MKIVKEHINPVAINFLEHVPNKGYATILADPPWRFLNRTGKVAPEHKRLSRYDTLSLEEIKQIPVQSVAGSKSHLYLWVPNALLPDGLEVMKAWGFTYKSNLIWHKVRKDGGPDGRGVGFYFRNTTELVLFGIRGSMRTLDPGRSQVNIIRTQKQEHSRKPDELYELIERCSPAPFLEIFARGKRKGWDVFGDQAEEYNIDWATYANHSKSEKQILVSPEPVLALEEPSYGFFPGKEKKSKQVTKK
jgi:N6-adenosine-specific RNA methylase IME4